MGKVFDNSSHGEAVSGLSTLGISRRNLIATPVVAGLPLLAGLFLNSGSAATPLPAGVPSPRVFRMYDGEDGLTHTERVIFEAGPGGVKGVQVLSTEPDKKVDLKAARASTFNLFHANVEMSVVAAAPNENGGAFHYGNRLELVHFIRGNWEFGTRDGKTLRIFPGDFLWAADNSGKGGGHTTRVIGPEWGLIIAAFL